MLYSTKPGFIEFDKITNTARLHRGDFNALLEHFEDLTGGLKDTTHRLLDILMRQLTQGSAIVQIPLDEFMNIRGLVDEKETRKQVNSDLEVLRNLKIASFTESKGKKGTSRVDMYLFGGSAIGISNSIIYFTFSNTAFICLKDYPTMALPDALFRIPARYKHAYGMGRFIYRHKRMNAGKPNENRISVKKLLEACPNIPRYEDLDKSRGEITRKIIEPFRNNLNALEDCTGLIKCSFCHSGGAPLTKEEEEIDELEGMPYSLFSELLIEFEFIDYPDQTKRITAKRKYAKKAEAQKKEYRENTKAAEALT
jgi:hypothetical protein